MAQTRAALLYFAASSGPAYRLSQVDHLVNAAPQNGDTLEPDRSMPGRKLNQKDLAAFKALLTHIRAVVAGDMTKLEQDAFGAEDGVGGVDATADGGSDRYSQEFSLELMEIDGNTLLQIDEALQRIESGSYGRCLECNCWIKKDRLRAIPHAQNCIECQRSKEQAQ